MTRVRAAIDRPPFSPWIARMVSPYGLPWWFGIESILGIAVAMYDRRRYLFFDARLVVGRQRAAWLVVPAIWPSQQFYYRTIAMPVGSKIALALVALPVPGNGLLALGALALVTWSKGDRGLYGSFRAPRRTGSPQPEPALDPGARG